jgi:hypothetical protein
MKIRNGHNQAENEMRAVGLKAEFFRQRLERVGNPGGSPEATRRLVNKAFLEALAEDFRQGGPEAIAKVRKYQPAAYMKICALLVPREMKLEHSGGVKAMTTEQIERSIELIKEMLAQREAGANAKVVEGLAEPAALPAPRKPRRKTRKSDTRTARPRRATLVGHRRLRAERSTSAFCSIWRKIGSSMDGRFSSGCAGKVRSLRNVGAGQD